jgi:hypothetical protein
MRSLPNKRHTELLLNLCTDCELINPYRAKYLNQKIFSYTPTDPLKRNRSRLDFFLVSTGILHSVSDTGISPFKQNSMFDHSAATLSSIPTINNGIKRPTISNLILKDPDLDLVVGLAVADTYLSCTAINEGIDIAGLKRGVGTSIKTLRELGVSDVFLTPGERTEAASLSRAARIAEIKDFLDTFPFDRLGTGAFARLAADPEPVPDPVPDPDPVGVDNPLVNCDDLFMEGLMNNVRKSVVSHQNFVFKSAKKNRVELVKKLKNLYTDPVANIDEITELENSLNKLVDSELRHELGKYSGFEVLNSEKLTPFFLSLAKASQVEAKMEDIKNANGERFTCPEDSKQFIRDFYANIYRKDPDEPANLDGCIERFLGPDICNNPIVLNSRVPEDIRIRLDMPITIHELDVSVLQANKSASGMDGISNCFIKKYWRFFRLPLYRYAKCVLHKQQLTPSFRSGLIKLIPKKGDTTRITNRRPISLLSCMYKVLSRALNNRLKVARDFIFSRAQKGFTNSRYIQEVLINLFETIGYCNKNEIPG